jgi:hypothetical protein
MVKAAFKQNWVVYAKRPFASPKMVVEYLGRYTMAKTKDWIEEQFEMFILREENSDVLDSIGLSTVYVSG